MIPMGTSWRTGLKCLALVVLLALVRSSICAIFDSQQLWCSAWFCSDSPWRLSRLGGCHWPVNMVLRMKMIRHFNGDFVRLRIALTPDNIALLRSRCGHETASLIANASLDGTSRIGGLRIVPSQDGGRELVVEQLLVPMWFGGWLGSAHKDRDAFQ